MKKYFLKKIKGGSFRNILILGARPSEKSHFNIENTDIVIYFNNSISFDPIGHPKITEEEIQDGIKNDTPEIDIINIPEDKVSDLTQYNNKLIIGNFNDLNFLSNISQVFEKSFDLIVSDIEVSKFFEFNFEYIKFFMKLLKDNGEFIFDSFLRPAELKQLKYYLEHYNNYEIPKNVSDKYLKFLFNFEFNKEKLIFDIYEYLKYNFEKNGYLFMEKYNSENNTEKITVNVEMISPFYLKKKEIMPIIIISKKESVINNDYGKEIILELTPENNFKSIYFGYIENGLKNRDGEIIYQDSSKYNGSWKDGDRNGFGIYIYNNGDIYKGRWKNDKKNGRGRIEKKDSIIMGEWKDDELIKTIEIINNSETKNNS